MSSELVAAYDATGAAWQRGPGRIYDRMAEVVVARCAAVRPGAVVLDLGAGTGAVSRAVRRRGGRPIALDAAPAVLAGGATGDAPPCVGDAVALPFAGGAFDVVVAAFSLNHLADPRPALREAVRVLRPGGALVVTAYAADDDHPVKAAAEAAAAAHGWAAPPWYTALRRDVMPLLATVDRAVGVARSAGLAASAEGVRVPFPDLGGAELVAWRLGMAHLAPFVGRLGPLARRALFADAHERLGPAPPVLVRSMIVLCAAADDAADAAADDAAGGTGSAELAVDERPGGALRR